MIFLKESFHSFFLEDIQINHKDMIELSSNFYENGISSIDLIHWFKQSNRWNEFEKSNICMLYSKIKREFRCEKLLMLFLLDFAFFRPKYDIKEISFM